MRILYFHQHFSTPLGAAGIRSYKMARRLVERGHQVTVVCGSYGPGDTGVSGRFLRGKRCQTVDGIEVIEFDLAYSNEYGPIKRSLVFLRFGIRSILIALARPCEVVFATSTPLTVALPGIVARWTRGRRFVFEVRDLWPELPEAMGAITNRVVLGALSVLEWIAYRSAHRLIGLSPGIVDGIARRGIGRERIDMIPNGCDLDIFASERRPWRPDEVGPSEFMAVYAGTHGVANGLDAVLDAAAILKTRGRRDIRLVLVGQGGMKQKLEARAARDCLTNVVFRGSMAKERLASLLASADLGLQILADVPAFYYGTSPNKFFDYLAAGLPVLANTPGWVIDMIEETKCGVAVPPGDPSAFADALERLADRREDLPAMRSNARRLAAERFDRTVLADRFVNWLEGAAGP